MPKSETEKTKIIRIRVSPQTYYHLCRAAENEHTTVGRIIDRLVIGSRKTAKGGARNG